MRPSEILRLKAEDVNLTTMKIYAWETKTERPRVIDIHPHLLPYLKELIDAEEDYLVKGDKPLTGDSVSRKIREVTRDRD